MQTEILAKTHEIRKDWQTIKSRIYLEHQKIQELEQQLKNSRNNKKLFQQELTRLEIKEKELLGKVKDIKSTKKVFKTDLEKAITTFVNKAFSQLSKPKKDLMIKTMLKEIGA